MKQYYSERNGLLKNELSLNIDELNEFLFKVYKFFNEKGYFKCAMEGCYLYNGYDDYTLIEPASMVPDPEVYITTKLQSKNIWPIKDNYMYYTEDIAFSLIEIFYDHIATYDVENHCKECDKAKAEFEEQINNILKFYNSGYYLERKNGFVMKMPNKALKEQLSYSGEAIPDDVYEQLQTAMELFYRFDSNMEKKRKAINILADILEKVRSELQDILNSEYEISKKEHDKLIFHIVNEYNIRHNTVDQKSDYSKEIWYDWMMQYYTSVIIAFYRLKEKNI